MLDARAELRARARRLGLLDEVVLPHARHVTPENRERALASTEGGGPVLDELWAEGR